MTDKTNKPAEIAVDSLGELHPPKTLILRVNVGTAQGPIPDDKYELTVSTGNFSPIVRSERSGRYFTLSWEDLIALAVARGVDNQ